MKKFISIITIVIILINSLLPLQFAHSALPLAVHALGILFVLGAGYIATQANVDEKLQNWWDSLTGDEQAYLSNVASDGLITPDELQGSLLQSILDKAPGKIIYVQNNNGNWVYRITLNPGEYLRFKGKYYVPTSLPYVTNGSNLSIFYKNPVSTSNLKITVTVNSNFNTLSSPVVLSSPITGTEYSQLFYSGNGNEDVEFEIKAICYSGTNTIELGKIKRYYVTSSGSVVDYYNADVAYQLIDANIMLGQSSADKVINNINNITNKTVNIANTNYVGVDSTSLVNAINGVGDTVKEQTGILTGISGILSGIKSLANEIWMDVVSVKNVVLDLPNQITNVLVNIFVPTVSLQTRIDSLKLKLTSKFPDLPNFIGSGSSNIVLAYIYPQGNIGFGLGSVNGTLFSSVATTIKYISRLLWLSMFVYYFVALRRRILG